MYAPLRVHSWFSLLTGVDSPQGCLARARELELPALALTDLDSLAGLPDVLKAARENAGPRPLVGAEVSDPRHPGRVIALVQNETGYRNLCKLVSARQIGDDPGDRRADLDDPEGFELIEAAARFQEGLFYLVDHPRLIFALAERVPRHRLAVAISPACLNSSEDPKGWKEEELDLGGLEPPKCPPPSRARPALALIRSARATGLAAVAVPDVYWCDPDGFDHHRVRTAIKHNALLADLPHTWLAPRPAHLPSVAEMERLYRDLPEVPGPFPRTTSGIGALERTLLIAQSCQFTPALGGVLFPEVELTSNETPYSRLCELAFEGARKRFVPLRPEVLRRLDFELNTIHELGFAPYFLLVKKIADFACQSEIPHVGRGSAADSLVAYCLELTDADPFRYRLPFERFLNPTRKDRPDIDLDFCWRRRDEIMERVWDFFGSERTAMIATTNRFGLRSAFREAALVQGIAPVEVHRWSRRLPGWFSGSETNHDGTTDSNETNAAPKDPLGGRGLGMEAVLPPGLESNLLARSFASTPECRDFPFEDPRFAFVLRMAAALLDAPRHLGLHPGGVVVAPGPITDFVSCQRATKGVIMTQLDKDGVEAIGLVKMDLLGNRALTVLDDCLKLLREVEVHVDLPAIAEDDLTTARLLARGETLGCFQVESPGMRNLLKQTAARNMDDVIQAVALIRPGPAGSGMKDAYVRRFRGLEEPHPPHPRLTEMLWDTHGVMLYQEDVMQAVVLMAGFDLAEADELRRALTRHRGTALEHYRERFFQGCDREGIAAQDARHVWELVSNFASFGFCKAHAVTYGRIAYQTVFLKAHYPAAYLVAFLNSETGYYASRVYIEEARRLGVPILPPDINRSVDHFTLERFAGRAPALRIGLDRVKNLSDHTLQTLLAVRASEGPFLSLPDFLTRTGARVDETERLIQCGAFDAFDRTRPEMLWRLHLFVSPQRKLPPTASIDPSLLAACRATPEMRARESAASRRVEDSREATAGWSGRSLSVGGLAPGESASLFPSPKTPAVALPALPDTDATTRGRLELDILGMSVSDHPTELFPAPTPRDRSRQPEQVPCSQLDRQRGRQIRIAGWLAASRRARTSDGRWMRFLSLEDTTGICEAVLFPDVYERDGHRLTERGSFLLLRGTVEDQMGACTLHVDRIE